MRGRRLRSARLALVTTFVLISSTVLLLDSSAPALAEASLSASIYPPEACSITPTAPCPITLRVTNTSMSNVSDVIASISAKTSPLRTLAETSAWFHPTSSVIEDELGLLSLDVGDLAPGETRALTTPIDLDAADFGRNWGVVGLNLDVEANGVGLASARTAVVWAPTVTPARTLVSTIVPLVAPANVNSFLTNAELTRLMEPGGLLTTQLAAATTASATAVDPRLIASIVRLGDTAPAASLEWLARLKSLTQPTIQLQYGDADFALEGQVGFSTVLGFTLEDVPSLTGVAFDDIWRPSIPNAFWAEPNTLNSASLAAMRVTTPGAPAVPPVLLAGSVNSGSSTDVRVDLSTASDATTTNTLVVNDYFTQSLRAAESAVTDEDWLRARAEVAAHLGVTASNGGGYLIGGYSRGLDEDVTYRTGQTQAFISSLPWAQPVSLVAALEQPSYASVLVDSPESPERLAGGASVLAHYNELAKFSSASRSPGVVMATAAKMALPALSVAWMSTDSEWPRALNDVALSTQKYVETVHIGITSNINMVGGQASIPITVVNGHPYDVTIVVRAVPSNPRLSVGADQRVTLSAESQGTVKIPVAARVGNGDVNLVLSLLTENGDVFGREVTVPVSVRADWEGFGLVIVGVLFTGLVATGVVRTIRRKRRADKDAS